MSGPAEVRPVITGTAEIRRAASSCCGARLRQAAGGAGICGQCGKRCAVVYGPPEQVTLHG